MQLRRDQWVRRTILTGVFAATFAIPLGILYIAAWVVTSVLLQLWEHSLYSNTRTPEDQVSNVRYFTYLLAIFLNCLLFGALPLAGALIDGLGGVAWAGFLLSGGICVTALMMQGSRTGFVVGMSAHLLYYAAMPILAIMDGASISAGVGIAVSGIMLFLGANQLWTENERRAQVLKTAVENAEAANRAKSAFLAIMSHEIRTPLNGVLGMAQAMAADDLSDVQHERLDVVRQSGESLLAILNDVLDLSKIEAGKLELEEVEFSLSEVLLGCQAAFTPIAQRKGVSFGLNIEQPAQGVYRGDPTRLRQILYNLISNALKFTDLGHVSVTVKFEGDELTFSVADTGIGLSADQVAGLFQKFVQADVSTTRRFGGTGLGLSIVRQLAELMGGSITVQSELNLGSTFTVRLPFARLSDESNATSPFAFSDGDACNRSDLRILVAEDNAVNQLVIKTLLHQAGLEPVVVDDGVQAVKMWESGDWDVVLMDVQMPQMDGLAATRQIRLQERRTGRMPTPIVALTANVMTHQIAEYRAAGMNGHVAKPIEVGALFTALDAALMRPAEPEADRLQA